MMNVEISTGISKIIYTIITYTQNKTVILKSVILFCKD